MTTKGVRHTRYINYKSFSDQRRAENFIESLKKLYPSRDFFVQRRKWAGKDKTRYMVRSKL